MSQFDDDAVSNFSDNATMHDVAAARISRRSVLGGGVASAALAATGGIAALLQAVPASAQGNTARSLLGFKGIATSTEDAVIVPRGYRADVLIAWGDPVSDGPEFRQDASNSAFEQEWQWGMHNDGVVYFPIHGSRRGLIVQNHEYTDDVLLFPDGTANWNQEKTNKSLAAHGVGIIEVRKNDNGRWRVVRPSQYARRITGSTPIRIGGPAAGDPRLATSYDPGGRRALGTINNCAMGFTPWGTYLACEENFNGYFRKAAGAPLTPLEQRYGLNASGAGYNWHLTDARFRIDPAVLPDQPDAPYEPNEPNRFGWVVEIDPFDPNSVPVKRTALGRMKHEGAWCQEARDGRLVVYMGDDEVFEYIYRYVSRGPWREMRRKGISPLNRGTLYVARFNDNGRGRWLPLTPSNPRLSGWSIEDILINTRGAADLAGGTRMDRPEWIDTFPDALTAVATLTNNSSRGVAGINPRTGFPFDPVDAINPRASNAYGQIVTWSYERDFTEPTFRWDIFALGGDPEAPETASTIAGDKYGSPDGIYVAPSGRLWIQTDVSGSTIDAGSYAGFGNNQMLCADPRTRETRRFLVGPRVSEITGVFVTPDERTMFVGIQHPGEAPSGANDPADPKRYSSWPDGPAGGRPRSALIAITKKDGGKIGT